MINITPCPHKSKLLAQILKANNIEYKAVKTTITINVIPTTYLIIKCHRVAVIQLLGQLLFIWEDCYKVAANIEEYKTYFNTNYRIFNNKFQYYQ